MATFEQKGHLKFKDAEGNLHKLAIEPSVHSSTHSADGSDPISPENIGAATAADHNIKTYTTLGQLGLSNEDMSAIDLAANLAKLFEAMPESSKLMKYGETGTDNLATSVGAKLATDVGIPVDTYYLNLEFTIRSYKPLAAELRVSITHIVPYVCDTYSCIYYHNATLTQFHRNQAVEYYWNLTPDSVGYNTLLEYMAARYSEHPVVFAHVSGFTDLPDGVTSGQAFIDICGGLLTVTLYTRNEVWYRGTNILTSWSNEWRKGYDSSNPPYTYGTTDLTPGTSPLETGKLYFVYE